MKKIYIVGIVASGKTTFARRLSQKYGIPWYELDAIVYHKTDAGRYKRSKDEQFQVIQEIDRDDTWIFEGTPRDSYQCLFDMADTILFLDPPLWKRRIRILTRFMKQKLGIEHCHYDPDLKILKLMYKWTRDFERNREYFVKQLNQYNGKVIRLTDRRQLDLI